jgi:hypothetical protein
MPGAATALMVLLASQAVTSWHVGAAFDVRYWGAKAEVSGAQSK